MPHLFRSYTTNVFALSGNGVGTGSHGVIRNSKDGRNKLSDRDNKSGKKSRSHKRVRKKKSRQRFEEKNSERVIELSTGDMGAVSTNRGRHRSRQVN